MAKYFMNDFQKEIWENNYRDQADHSIQDTWMRVARSCAAIEKDKRKWTEKFYSILEDFKFVPGGRILANIGTDRQSVTLMNCFAHNPKDIHYENPDSLKGIFAMLEAQALTLKSEGGYGTNFSYIRPAGTVIIGVGVAHPGVVKYMEMWDKSSEIITEGSDEIKGKLPEGVHLKKKIRKGAMMGVLNVWHPDIVEFVNAKQQPNRLTKFNLSVGITENFMDAVENNDKWELKFPDITFPKYQKEWTGDIYDWEKKEYPVIVYETVKARELWDKIAYATYTRNEPGIMFLDLANRFNPMVYAERILQSNPCGEIMMSTGVCNLGSINLVKFVKEKNGADVPVFDFDHFKQTVSIGIRLLDNINDISSVPLPEYKESMVNKRRIGLGVMGLGSLHFIMGIKYGSEESLKLTQMIFKIKAEQELLASSDLGTEKGSFPLFDKRKYFSTTWWRDLKISTSVKNQIRKNGEMRNSHRSANAPTGTISIFAGIISGGIEPVFQKEYTRWMIVPPRERTFLREQGLKFPDISKGEWTETRHFKFATKGDEEILKGTFEGTDYEVDKNRGLIKAVLVEDYGWKSVRQYSLFPINSDVYVSAQDLSIKEHLAVLKIVSEYTDMNSSKTVNLPADCSFNDFKEVYSEAYKAGIKGLTTYREGTMTAVLEKKNEVEEEQNDLEKIFRIHGDKVIKKLGDSKLPKEYNAKGFILRDAHTKTKWYINIAFADKHLSKPYAIFVTTNSKESSEVTNETIRNLEELALKKGVDKDLIEIQRQKYEGQPNVMKIARSLGFCLRHNIPILDIVDVLEKGDYPISSFVFHIKKLLMKFVRQGTKVKGQTCPNCEGNLVYQEGCFVCTSCGYSKCT